MTTDYASSTTESEIRGLIENRVRAIREKDVDAVVSEYAPDLVMFNLAPPLQSKGVNKKGIEKWFSQYEGVIDCEIRDLSISTGDDLAYSHYLHRITEIDGRCVAGHAVETKSSLRL